MVSTGVRQRLSNGDAAFLYMDRPNQPQHIGSIAIYDGPISRADMIRILEERLHLVPRYRQRLVSPPFGLAHPVWEDDPTFAVAKHVREVTLPPGTDARALCEIGGRLFAPGLDRARPLWETILLQGYEGDKTCVLSKVHHCMIDGVSGVDLSLVLSDLTPDAAPPPPPDAPWQPAPPADPLTLLEDAVRDTLVDAAERWTESTFSALRPTDAAARAQRLVGTFGSPTPATLQIAPPTPFNRPLSPERGVAWIEWPFAEVRRVKGVLGGTVNDLMLAVIAGGLGRYLRGLGYPTAGVELRANCPVSMRRPDERGALGNRISIIVTPLYVGVADPVERLNRQREAMDRLKQEDQAGAMYALTEQGQTPAWLQALAAQVDVPNTFYNTVCTNVPGPQIPLYFNGHKSLGGPGFGNLTANIGLFNGIGTYNQGIFVSATVDPRQVPDPWRYIDCLAESYAELRAAAEAQAGTSVAAPAGVPAVERTPRAVPA